MEMAHWLGRLLRRPEPLARQGSGPIAFEAVRGLNAPFEIVAVPGALALQAWRELNLRSGTVPVLLGQRKDTDTVLEAIAQCEDAGADIIAAGSTLDLDAWLLERVAGDADYYKYDSSMTVKPQGTSMLSPARDIIDNKPHAQVFYALVPVEQSWQVPAILKPGGWNECPEPAEHLAFFKRWDERYGARIVSYSGDIIEFVVARPPATMEEAQQLAREQFLYCPDIVHQGVGTGGNLAALLLESDNWYFWWD